MLDHSHQGFESSRAEPQAAMTSKGAPRDRSLLARTHTTQKIGSPHGILWMVQTDLAHRAAVREAQRGEPYDLAGGLITDHIEMVLQWGVLRALEVHQLCFLIHPDLPGEQGAECQRKTADCTLPHANCPSPGKVTLNQTLQCYTMLVVLMVSTQDLLIW